MLVIPSGGRPRRLHYPRPVGIEGDTTNRGEGFDTVHAEAGGVTDREVALAASEFVKISKRR